MATTLYTPPAYISAGDEVALLDAILAELGYDMDEAARIKAEGII